MSKNRASVSVEEIVIRLHQGEVVAYPTEAVFGLGCDPDNQQAVEKLLALKQRAWQKGLILVAANYQQLAPYIDDRLLTSMQRQQMLASWPGPVTWVIPKRVTTPAWLSGSFNSLAVRVTAHAQVQALCQAFGKPLVSTSANLAGHPPCRTEQEVRQQFSDDFLILAGQIGGQQRPSEIRDALTGQLVRPG